MAANAEICSHKYDISYFFLNFKMASAAILDLQLRMPLEFSGKCFNVFMMPELVENESLFVSLAHLVPEICFFLNFKISSAAILD